MPVAIRLLVLTCAVGLGTEVISAQPTSGGRGGDVDARYQVVINHEEQYALWPAAWKISEPWKATGREGTLIETMAYIEEVWTDMRPLSVRRRMKEAGQDPMRVKYRVVLQPAEIREPVNPNRSPEEVKDWSLPEGYWGYMLWPTDMPPAAGLEDTGHGGSFREATAYIEEVWTDMRPLSVQMLHASAPGFGDRRKGMR